LNLILAHQYINQLIFDGNSTVRDAVFGNVGTLVSFRVGAEDAEHLEKEFEPIFMMNDIVNLPKYHIYLKLMIDGIAGDAFSAGTLPPADLADTEHNEAKAINISRERYGKSREKVEEKIARWSGIEVFKEKKEDLVFSNEDDDDEIAPVQEIIHLEKKPSKDGAKKPSERFQKEKSDSNQEKVSIQTSRPEERLDEKGRVLYKTLCDTCEEEIWVPFAPDPKKPAFCKECLKDYQRLREKTKLEEQRREQEKNPNQNVLKNQNSQNNPSKKPDLPTGGFVSKEKPLSLSQLQHLGPKKFRDKRG
jgi:CxxC-x17-CxxC domain-containing protein